MCEGSVWYDISLHSPKACQFFFISFHTAASETINSLTPQSLKCHQVQQTSPPTQTCKDTNAGADLSTEQCVPLCQHYDFRGRRDITQRSHFKSPAPANRISKRRMLHYSCYLVFPFEHPGRFWRSAELQCRSSSFTQMKIRSSVWTTRHAYNSCLHASTVCGIAYFIVLVKEKKEIYIWILEYTFDADSVI